MIKKTRICNLCEREIPAGEPYTRVERFAIYRCVDEEDGCSRALDKYADYREIDMCNECWEQHKGGIYATKSAKEGEDESHS